MQHLLFHAVLSRPLRCSCCQLVFSQKRWAPKVSAIPGSPPLPFHRRIDFDAVQHHNLTIGGSETFCKIVSTQTAKNLSSPSSGATLQPRARAHAGGGRG